MSFINAVFFVTTTERVPLKASKALTIDTEGAGEPPMPAAGGGVAAVVYRLLSPLPPPPSPPPPESVALTPGLEEWVWV